MGILERRAAAGPISRALIDTPGQIECFVWSVPGAITADALAPAPPSCWPWPKSPTPRAQPSRATFMANMLYACSILYKTKLPMVLVFNRADVHDAAFAREWTTDFKAFQRALRASEQSGGGEDALDMSSLLNFMSLVLAIDEFYNHLDVVAVSTTRGIGIDDFLDRQKSPQLVELLLLSPSLAITLNSKCRYQCHTTNPQPSANCSSESPPAVT